MRDPAPLSLILELEGRRLEPDRQDPAPSSLDLKREGRPPEA